MLTQFSWAARPVSPRDPPAPASLCSTEISSLGLVPADLGLFTGVLNWPHLLVAVVTVLSDSRKMAQWGKAKPDHSSSVSGAQKEETGSQLLNTVLCTFVPVCVVGWAW